MSKLVDNVCLWWKKLIFHFLEFPIFRYCPHMTSPISVLERISIPPMSNISFVVILCQRKRPNNAMQFSTEWTSVNCLPQFSFQKKSTEEDCPHKPKWASKPENLPFKVFLLKTVHDEESFSMLPPQLYFQVHWRRQSPLRRCLFPGWEQ